MKRDDLLARIRDEASRLEPQLRQPSLYPPSSGPVRADDLLRYERGDFVDALYRRILQREPDEAGRAFYLSLLDRLPKPVLIYYMARSEEARQSGAKVIGVYSALARLYLRVPLAVARVFPRIVMGGFSRLNSRLSAQKAENNEPDYFKFYYGFEEAFRGSEENTEEGLRVYLSLLHPEDGPIVDLGSGRGEWLELLREEGFGVKGVEINPYFAQKCREKGLVVEEGDVFSFLKNAGTSSIGAITAFHLIEHLEPLQRLKFLAEIQRVLRPGGLLILETPNPRNILVSAGDFWRDVEHARPVFPDTLSFMTEFVGFSDVKSYFFKEKRTALIPCSDVVFKDLKDYIEVSRDFAVSARKS